jgi:hypothetical protein
MRENILMQSPTDGSTLLLEVVPANSSLSVVIFVKRK